MEKRSLIIWKIITIFRVKILESIWIKNKSFRVHRSDALAIREWSARMAGQSNLISPPLDSTGSLNPPLALD